MRNRKCVSTIWTISIGLYVLLLVILKITQMEKILLAIIAVMFVCIAEELFLKTDDVNDNDNLFVIAMSPSFFSLLVLILITIRVAGFFNVTSSTTFVVSTISVSLLLVLIRWIINYRKEKMDIVMVFIIAVVFLIYWEASAVAFYTLNCELDDSENVFVDAHVIDKGYCDDGIKLPDPLKRLVVDVSTEEYGELLVNIPRENYVRINKGDKIKISVGEGSLGTTYYYIAHKWMYPYTESTLFNSEYKEFLSHEKCIRD